MRHHDITEPMDMISLKSGWFQVIAGHIMSGQDNSKLEAIVAKVNSGRSSVADVAIEFMPILREEHPLYRGLVGSAVYRSALQALGIYDPIYRPAPGRIKMGSVDGVPVYYHPDTREYEVSYLGLGIRYPALYVPTYGIDVGDAGYAEVLVSALKENSNASKAERISLPGFSKDRPYSPI